jgi:hypothetical protein
MKLQRFCTAFLLTCCGLVTSTSADELLVDRHYEFNMYDGVGTRLSVISSRGTVGFSFTPTLDSIGFAEVLTQLVGDPYANLQLAVLSNTTVIGLSDVLLVTNTAPATNQFRFNPGVPLAPGATYVAEVRSLDNFWALFGRDDLYYREGAVLAAPIPPVLTILNRPSQAELTWSSRLGTVYQVQYASELSASAWSDRAPPIVGNGLTNRFSEAITNASSFYRLVVLP